MKADDVADTFKRTVHIDSEDRGRRIYDSLVSSYGNDRDLALRKFVQAYLACVAAVDDQVGQVLDALDDLPIAENTIVVFTSDHGWQMGRKRIFTRTRFGRRVHASRSPSGCRA